MSSVPVLAEKGVWMRHDPIIADETARLAALAELGEFDDDTASTRLDALVALARRLFNVPIALVSLVGRDRQVFAARSGIAARETSRDLSFCAHAIRRDELLIVPDAAVDPRFAANPLVLGDPGIRFYAGAPLRTAAGHALGALCIIDRVPRRGLPARDRESLRDLARLAVDQLELRRLERAGQASQRRFQNIAATSPDGIVCADRRGRITFWNDTATRLFGYAADEALGAPLDILVPEGLRTGHGNGLRRVAAGGEPKLVGKTVELEARHKNGRTLAIELSLSMWQEDGETSFGAIMRDITERRRSRDQLYALAHNDWLTDLPNRAELFERMGEAIAADAGFSLLRIDIDKFKEINDSVGHAAGDAVLREIARRILACLAPGDILARLGGDEFAVLVPARSRSLPATVADRLIADIKAPLAVEGKTLYTDVSVGIAAYPGDGVGIEDLVGNAGLALYQAKGDGRGCRRVFVPRLRESVAERRAFETELRRAYDQGEFILHYQPQVELADGRLTGAEALIRWQHPTRGLLSPADFLPAIERQGGLLAEQVGAWTLASACAQAVPWRAQVPGFQVGVNLFEAQFRTGDLHHRVEEVLRRTGLPPAALELEVTENIILRHDQAKLDALHALHDIGVSVSFDDFGTGFASLSVLKAYPLSRLKIDRSFVTNIADDPTDALIISAVAMLGRGLGLDVIAEGVESEEHRDLLRACGCSSGQGYLFGRPMPAEAFSRLVAGGVGNGSQPVRLSA